MSRTSRLNPRVKLRKIREIHPFPGFFTALRLRGQSKELQKPRSSASAHSLRQAIPRPKAPETYRLARRNPSNASPSGKTTPTPLLSPYRYNPTQPVRYAPPAHFFPAEPLFLHNHPTRLSGPLTDMLRTNPNPLLRNRRLIPRGSAPPRSIAPHARKRNRRPGNPERRLYLQKESVMPPERNACKRLP